MKEFSPWIFLTVVAIGVTVFYVTEAILDHRMEVIMLECK